jgi:hypothetical protein
MAALLLKLADKAFLPRILVPSDHDRVFVLPQVKYAFIFPAVEKKVLLHRKVLIRVCVRAFYIS